MILYKLYEIVVVGGGGCIKMPYLDIHDTLPNICMYGLYTFIHLHPLSKISIGPWSHMVFSCGQNHALYITTDKRGYPHNTFLIS